MIIQHNGLQLSSYPTSSHKLLIHVRINSLLKQKLQEQQKIDQNPKNQFELSTGKKHIKAYVDPSQLSYNSYENILNLDEFYFGPIFDAQKKLKITIENFEKVQNHYKFKINDHENLLMQLHKMNLYSLPFNNLSRGGKRMIFSSLLLADVLQKQLESSIQEKQDYEKLCQDLNSINHVFRLNCFSPESSSFKTHYDTPFSDNQRKLYSKYTLLIYLTGGSNNQNPCLRIQDEKISQIPAFTGIIFDQRYEHEGWPYIEGQKIFLRSELIYHIKDIDEDERVAQIFNKACYFHKESLYDHKNNLYAQQLQNYSNQLFNHTAKLRYLLAEKKEEIILQRQKRQEQNNDKTIGTKKKITLQVEQKYLLKKNFDIFYVTNGNSFWFRESVPLKLAAKMVLVDYFNGRMDKFSSKQIKDSQKMKIKSKPFNLKLHQNINESKNLNGKMEEQNSLKQYFNSNQMRQKRRDEQILQFLNQFSFEDQGQTQPYPFNFKSIVDTGIKDYDIQQYHCGLCSPGDFQTSQSYEIQAINICQTILKNKMIDVGVILFNGKLHIDDCSIQVDQEKGEISFNQAFLNKTINFASCQCETYQRRKFIGKQTVQIQGFLLPKMNYHKLQLSKGYKLSIDMFKNGFIHRIKTYIPRSYAVDPNKQSPSQYFYDSNDEYVDSDCEYKNQSRKKKPSNQVQNYSGHFLRKRRNNNNIDEE